MKLISTASNKSTQMSHNNRYKLSFTIFILFSLILWAERVLNLKGCCTLSCNKIIVLALIKSLEYNIKRLCKTSKILHQTISKEHVNKRFVCPDVWSYTVAAHETLYVFMYIIYIPIYYHKSQNAINCD